MTKYEGAFPVVERKIDTGKKVGEEANKLAYKTNSSKANYPKGKPTEAFKRAMAKVFKGFHFWNAWSKVGASCDVFVGVCVRSAGVDKKFPAGLWKQLKYMQKHLLRVEPEKTHIQNGDIFIYRKDKAGKHGHIGIFYDGKVKEASAHHFYGKTTDTMSERLSKKGKKYVYVFRFKDSTSYVPLKNGSKGEDVERLQKYINWYYGKSVLKVDGIFGKLTEAKVKFMQKALGLKVDGIVGKLTLAKMKEVKR